jgi:hypothetical protein
MGHGSRTPLCNFEVPRPHRLIERIKQEGKEGQALWPGSLRTSTLVKSRAFGAPCAWPRGLLHVAIAPRTGGHVANGV